MTEPTYRAVRVIWTSNRDGKSYEHFEVEERKRFLWWTWWEPLTWNEMGYPTTREFDSLEKATQEADFLNSGMDSMSKYSHPISSTSKGQAVTKFERDDTLKLGDKARDQISGFTGTVVAITEWLNGCRRITIQPSALHEGKPVEVSTFDAEQIAKVEEGPALSPTRSGGPSIAPVRAADPR